VPRFRDRLSLARWPYAAALAKAAVPAAALASAGPGASATLSSDPTPAGYTVTRVPTGNFTHGVALTSLCSTGTGTW
jgi:hypothetical protein